MNGQLRVSRRVMSSRDTDRNLLFGVLALQLDLIEPDQFAEACSAWSARKDVPLADLLCERGWIGAEDRADVERLILRKLAKNGGDAREGLATLVGRRVGDTLASIDDFEIHSVVGEAVQRASTPTATTVDRRPESRDHYPLLRLHAQGGLGRVWLARDPVLGRDIALKELRPERADDPWFRARFLEEARITGQLEHPGIVTVHELAMLPGDRSPFYTMRFVRGRTMTDVVHDHHGEREACQVGPLELTELLNAFIAACNAVAYAHSRGVIHRDIKGQNIVLGHFGEVVLLDWGLAKLVGKSDPDHPAPPVVLDAREDHGHTLPGQLLGTPGYMAPEQAEGRSERIGPWSDIYGLGAVLYEILTGKPPFGGSSVTEAVRLVVEEEPEPPRRVCPSAPPALEAVCRRAMAKRPEDRYASATELAADVQRWLVDEPVSVYRDPATVRLGRWARRHRSAVTVGAALLVAAVGVLALSIILVVREQGRTVTAYDAEAGQRRRAESNYRLARDAVDRMYYNVLGDPLLVTPHMAPLRAKLLRLALESYDRLVDASREDRDLRYHLAYTSLRYARVAREGGRSAEAIDSGEKCLAILTALVREEPGRADYRNDLAVCQLDLGDVFKDAGQLGRAETMYRAAATIWDGLNAGAPSTKVNRLRAAAYDALGTCYQATGKFEDAALAHQVALRTWEEVTATNPDGPGSREARYHLAACRSNLANLHFRLGRWAQAEESFRHAAENFEELLRQQPEERLRNKLAYVYQGLGKVRDRQGDPAGAVDSFERSLTICQKLYGDHPEAVEFRFNLATSHRWLGDLLNPAEHPPGDPERARAHYAEALKLWESLAREHPDDAVNSNGWAKTLYGLGRCDLATNRPDEARASFARARDLWEALPGEMRAEYERDFRPRLRAMLDELKRPAPG
jgi:tetratricopeptide (TPR) repeat protein/tRNA A-37 threonylcarbamoyl transferase component Bud32